MKNTNTEGASFILGNRRLLSKERSIAIANSDPTMSVHIFRAVQETRLNNGCMLARHEFNKAMRKQIRTLSISSGGMASVCAIVAAVRVVPHALGFKNCAVTISVPSQVNSVLRRRRILTIQFITTMDLIVAIRLRVFVDIVIRHKSFLPKLRYILR